MTIIVILNVVLAVSIVAAIVSLLGWGIAAERTVDASLSGHSPRDARAKTIRRNRRLLGLVVRRSAAGRV